MRWKITLLNKTDRKLDITEFGIWISYAYVMSRDKNVLRNIHNSAAVFPSISENYTKLAIVRRDGEGESLGMYQVKGDTVSVGTYCDYENLFFENVSPSLDGMLFHKLYLAGGYENGFKNHDWIYSKEGFEVEEHAEKTWEYVICSYTDQEDFYKKGLELGHPQVEYTPLNISGETVRGSLELPEGLELVAAEALYKDGQDVKTIPVSVKAEKDSRRCRFSFCPEAMGEHKVEFIFNDGTEDFVVLNVMDDIETVIEERAAYICDTLYTGADGDPAYAFQPISNQGESLGKANLVLKKNLLGKLDAGQVRKVEKCAVEYVCKKWFADGDFKKPVKLYGSFYRCMDFEYIGHLFYLLSEFDDSVLELHDSDTYLRWAAEVFDLRVNPDLHEDEGGKEEAQMLGVYFLYFGDLMKKLKEKGLTAEYERIQNLWEKVINRIDKEAPEYKAAITEHFYDNAGFGPTAGALAESGKAESAARYGNLLLANIGYSNDFRAQNPDRWWEALTYMIHSLWGGVTAVAAYKVFDGLKDVRYLKASYRATAGILYCYDTHSTATTPLKKGMAASMYAVAGPHLNRPDLSRDRFGQSTFYRDGGIFARLFENDSQTPDWDMGEELVAYLENFGDKTYIIRTEDGMDVINGCLEETDTEYKVTSFAPYIRKYYYISGNYRVIKKGQSHVERRNLGDFDLIVVKKGCLFLAEEDEKYEVGENEMFILLPDRHHYSWKPCEEDTGFYWMHFYTTSQWVKDEKARIMVSRLPIPNLHFHQCSYTLHLAQYAKVKEPEVLFGLMQDILDSTTNRNDIWKTEELFLKFLRFTENLGVHKDRMTVLAEQIQAYLEKNIDQNITNESLEATFHMHKNYLARAMKAAFGKTPLEMLGELRMSYAKEYLIRTDYSIQKIAKLVGFHSDIYFSSCFKKYMDIAPRDYRKKYEGKLDQIAENEKA